MWSMTGGATQHMQFAHALPAGMVFAAGGGVAHPESSLGVQVTEAVLPVSPMPANPDDVVMSESGRAVPTGRGHLGSTPTDEGQAQAMIPRASQSPATTLGNAGIRGPSRSTKSEMTSRSGRSRYSATSGAFQVAPNAMRSAQDMLARMKSKQDTTQAQLNQRVDQGFQAIQILAARPGAIKSVTVPKVEAPTAPVQVSTGPADAVSNETASHEVARALKAAETYEAEAEKAKESWTANLQNSLNDQWEFVMSAQMQLQATFVQHRHKFKVSVRQVYQRSGYAIKDGVAHSQNTSGDSAFAAQLQLTLPSVTETKYEKGDVQPKEEQGSRIAKTSGSRAKSRPTEAKSTGAARSEDKEPPEKELRKKPSRQDEDPSGSSSSGESTQVTPTVATLRDNGY
ncbi:hypothetical protein PHMEG_00021926 [Phytophthora megakarya]|uniref:Uncharacterized protein n=1 Tax=Phytophthora megakarya TaxID=4795 RepID=A0A225VLL5_9STRA|nr:hypothetical protein PHMEG_00021926 [Phytophthora megakarya]